MRPEKLAQFEKWYDQYINTFYGDDKYINANIRLKHDHARRVVEEMRYLADSLALDENRRRIAETIALFHDIGRFEQFIRYQTYHDPKSIDHNKLGVKILCEKKILDIDIAERQLVEKAIALHGTKQLPTDLSGDEALFCKLIRDADKLDIYQVVINGYRRYLADPDNFDLEVELPNEPFVSPEIVEAVLNGKRVGYEFLKTWNDMKVLQLGWVYDINFASALRRIRERKLLEQIVDFLPKTPQIEQVKKVIFKYMDDRIKNNVNL
ncbi:MAG: HD domain-containing protein [Phycisphaerae bacterium]|nr:HD domain-containing protein [Phycisphaerae bacterium]